MLKIIIIKKFRLNMCDKKEHLRLNLNLLVLKIRNRLLPFLRHVCYSIVFFIEGELNPVGSRVENRWLFKNISAWAWKETLNKLPRHNSRDFWNKMVAGGVQNALFIYYYYLEKGLFSTSTVKLNFNCDWMYLFFDIFSNLKSFYLCSSEK